MKNIIKVEEACMLLLSVILNSKLPYPAWLFWLLFLTPDVGMVGYIINKKIGAVSYNLLHHKGVAILFYLAGLYFSNNALQFTGLLLFAHSSFDRMLGYGLKYHDSFQHTHLGQIGNPQNAVENQ
jgi:hypothetical protein